jgi:IPT/TIG domain
MALASLSGVGPATATTSPSVVRLSEKIGDLAVTSPACFPSSTASCSSANPLVTLSWYGADDTSVCTFHFNFDWGDGGPIEVKDFAGGPADTTFPFTHTYSTKEGPRHQTYAIQVSTSAESRDPRVICSADDAAKTFTLDCVASPVPVTLPSLSFPVRVSDKPIRIGYAALPLSLAENEPPADAACSFSASGALPITVDLGPAKASVSVSLTSNADVKVDVLKPGGVTPPRCDWKTLLNFCLLGGAGDQVVRWHTDGFSEHWHGMAIPGASTGPLTFYALTSSAAPVAQAVQQAETTFHVTLSEHLQYISRLGVFQEPPVDLNVVDDAGRSTGVSDPNMPSAEAIPYSEYVTNGTGYSAVVVLAPAGSYVARAVGAPRSPYSLSAAYLSPGPSGQATVEVSSSGTLDSSGQSRPLRLPGAVTAIAPDHGPTAGGTSVIISGLGLTGASEVYFGTLTAPSFRVVSDTQIIAVAPAQPAGTHHVRVVTNGKRSRTSDADRFVYDRPGRTDNAQAR